MATIKDNQHDRKTAAGKPAVLVRGSIAVAALAVALALPYSPAPQAATPYISAVGLAAGGYIRLTIGPVRCSPARLRATIGRQTGGAGSVFTTVVLRNVGVQSCALRGYPGVSLLDGQHRQIGRAASWDPGTIRLVTLLPGGAASTLVHTLNPGVGTTACVPQSTALRIYPPGGRVALFVPVRLSECLGTLGVLPVVAGINGIAP